MTAPDFISSVTELFDYGVTDGFLIKDITGAYDVSDNPGGWELDANGSRTQLAPADILKALLIVTPYKSDPVPIVLEMTNVSSAIYWKKLLSHLAETGIIITKEMLDIDAFSDGHWQFNLFFWPGYRTATFSSIVSGIFESGEIVVGQTSGASAYLLKLDASPYHIVPIQGTFLNGETITGQTSGASVVVATFVLVGTDLIANEVYSYNNHQSVLTIKRNIVRKLPLDIVLPRINEKHAYNVTVANNMIDTLDDAIEVGQIANYEEIYDFLDEYINRIDQTYCV